MPARRVTAIRAMAGSAPGSGAYLPLRRSMRSLVIAITHGGFSWRVQAFLRRTLIVRRTCSVGPCLQTCASSTASTTARQAFIGASIRALVVGLVDSI